MTAASTFKASTGEGYELVMGRWSRRLAVPFLAFAGASSGERVLDVGCGTGSLTSLLSQRPDVEAICGIDFAPAYIEHASRKHRGSAGLPSTLATPARWPSRRGVRPGPVAADAAFRAGAGPGRGGDAPRGATRRTVAAAVWDVRGGFVANRLFFDTAAALDPAAALRRAKNYTRPMTRPGELASAWRDAGFAAIEAAELAIRMEFASFDDYWAPYAGKDGPAAEYVATLDAAAGAGCARRSARPTSTAKRMAHAPT